MIVSQQVRLCVFQCVASAAHFLFMEVEKMIYALAVLVYLAVNFLFATLMNNIAVNKGHENSHAFVLVFLFGISLLFPLFWRWCSEFLIFLGQRQLNCSHRQRTLTVTE